MYKQSPNTTNKIFTFSLSGLIRFLVLLCITMQFGTLSGKDKLTTVQINLPVNLSERSNLLSLLDIDHFHEKDGHTLLTLDEYSFKKLKSFTADFKVVSNDAIEDLIKKNKQFYARQNSGISSNERVALEQNGQVVDNIISTPAAFEIKPTLGGYYSFAEMVTAMDNLVAAYPSIAQKFSIGTSVEGRDMWCIKISDNVSEDETDEPELLYMGHHHAREAIGGASMIFLMQYLCENYVTNTNVSDLINNREFFIIVCANPDGWEYNRTTNPNGGGQWRKNRSNNGDGSFGVDLNRNWGIDWANCTGALGSVASCGSNLGSSDVYWGASAFSEPETVNLKNFVQSRHFAVSMDQHSVGPYYSLPFGRLTRTMAPSDNQIYTQMVSVMGKYNAMRYGNTYQTLGYEVSGGMKDWLLIGDTLNIGKVYGMTGEGGNGSSTTQFWPLAADIIKLCKGMTYQNLQLAYTAGSYVDFQDEGSINIQNLNGKFYFKTRRIGLENKPVTITVIPLQNITSVGAPITIASLPSFNSTYRDSISYQLPAALATGKTIKFVWKVETGGYTYYDTVTNIYKPTVLFTDNAESGNITSKWTVSSSWAYTTDEAFNSAKSLAESPNGTNYTSGTTRTITSKTNLNLSGASTAFLSFWVKHRCENYQDKLQLEVSTNGTTWVAISGLTTIKEPGTADGSTINGIPSMTGIRENWSREIFDLSGFLGASALRFRMVFTSDASGTYLFEADKGFNIDNFIAISSTVNPNTLQSQNPVSLQGKNIETKNMLQLEMVDISYAKNYVIERSTNGVDYDVIAVEKNSEYIFTDNNPYQGENLYRVKVENTDGTFKYTNLVVLDVKQSKLLPTGIVSLFPNPADNFIKINFNVTEEQSVFKLNVFNLSGQIVYHEILKLNSGLHTIDLNASDFSSGDYIISFRNLNNNVSYENKFVKL